MHIFTLISLKLFIGFIVMILIINITGKGNLARSGSKLRARWNYRRCYV